MPYRIGTAIFLLAAVCFMGSAGVHADAPDPAWSELVYCRKAEGNLTLKARWYPASGFRLLIRSRATGESALLEISEQALTLLTSESNAPPWRSWPVRLRNIPVLKEPKRDAAFLLKFREDEWQLYLDDALVGMVPAVFEPPVDIYWPAETPARLEDKPRFHPVPREEFKTDFMIEEGAPNQLYPWKIETGSWRIHTAMQDALTRPESNISRIQQVPLTPDKSPNFYSLKGGGKDAIITTGYPFFDDYEYDASMQVNDGKVGLVFYHTDNDNYYAFTIELHPGWDNGGILELFRVRKGERTVLGRVRAPLFLYQWYQPRIQAHTDEIVCLLDNVEVIRIVEDLPPGGKIGLYADTKDEIRFDDVSLRALRRLPLRNVGEIRYQTLFHDGHFYREKSFFRHATPDAQAELRPVPGPDAQTLVVGRAQHCNVVFGATFEVAAPVYEVGLVCGFRSADKPYYLFTVHRSLKTENYRLQRVRRGHVQLLESWVLDSPPADTSRIARLLVDASEPGRLKLLRNERMVLMIPLDEDLLGGAGPYVGAETEAVIRDLNYGFNRQRYLEQENKNPVFQHDSFMRHWAAPEGQWIAGEKGFLWHKGDFFGDFMIRLPCIAESELHMGIRDGETTGPLMTSVDHDGNLLLRITAGPEPEGVTYTVPLPKNDKGEFSGLDYSVFREGYWIWVEIEGRTILKHRLAAEIPGSRVRVEGLTLEHLARSKVTRANVIDDFFTASPYHWIVNGGNWQIINRFQCTPSWSHMIGESADSLAALWYKYAFRGDLTLEFYAGTRHGWYERAGDLNCTVMANDTSASSGYSVTCTEWDYNLSQNWTTLYRNGQVVDRSDKYLVPRRRKGMVRKFLNPLVAAGRPIHGAWYYIKLRKVGNRVEYYFDNEKIFEFEDPAAFQEGLVGIWTFMQSMTLAQIKMTFTDVHPREFTVEPLPLDADFTLSGPPEAEEPPATSGIDAVKLNGYPLDSLNGRYWSLEDPVGQSRLEPKAMNASLLSIENRLGAGNMLVHAELPPLPLYQLAGWRFMLRRTPGACFNMHYSIGTVDDKGAYTPTRHFYHHISGTDFSEGTYGMTGNTPVPGSASPASPTGGWQSVTAWIPTRVRSASDEKQKLYARLEGFGNIQISEMMAGIKGNAPGDGYEVRQLTPICYGLPEFSVTEPAEACTYVLRTEPSGQLLCETSSLDELHGVLAAAGRDGFNSAWLKVYTATGEELFHDVLWVQLPETLPLSATWDSAFDETLVVACGGGYPDRRFADVSLRIGGTPVSLIADNTEARTAKVPETIAGKAPEAKELPISVTAGGQNLAVTLPWAGRSANRGPVLLGLDGLTPFVHTFEDGSVGKLSFAADGRMQILHDDPLQGDYLQVQNKQLEQRLNTTFSSGISLARFPLLQFRYRAFDMAHLSITYKNYHYVRLGDDYASAVSVRMGHDLLFDETWHSWIGMVTDAFTQESFDIARFTPESFSFASAGSPDQTGRYSKWDLDDVVYGPAVAGSEQLAVTPSYVDPDGIEAVFSAISAGETCFADLSSEARKALSWRQYKSGEKIVPDTEKLSEGTHHLLFKALDTRGEESVVMDVPFLLDRTPLAISHAFGSYSDPASNGKQLTILMKNQNLSPWDIEKATFLVQGAKATIPAWTSQFRHRPGADQLVLNYPFIFRTHLDAAKDGDVLSFVIADIADGAGNPSPQVEVPIKVDYSSDKTGPAWYAFYFGDSVHWFWNWDGCRSQTPAFSPGDYNTINVVHTAGHSPFLHTQTYRTNGDLSRAVQWKPATHPWLSFRLRLPDYNRKGNLAIHVILTAADGKAYSISLTDPGQAVTELNRTQTFAWKRGDWERFSFNVRDMLKAAGVTDEAIAGMVITGVNFQRRNAKNKESLYLDDFFIHGPAPNPAEPDLLKWYAYDASGVEALEMSCVDADDKVLWTETRTERQVDLNPLRAKISGGAWIRAASKDKAGNLSVPFWIPLGN